MIEFTKEFCKNEIIELWQSSFGDSKEYIEYVYNVFEKHGRFYGIYDGKTLVSMMLVLDLPLNFYKKTQKSAYMYACTTRKEYRTKGCFSKLYNMAKQDLVKDGFENIYCVPESQELFDMYQKVFGFDKCLYRGIEKGIYDNKKPKTEFKQSSDFDRAYNMYCKSCEKMQGYCLKSREIFTCAMVASNAKLYFFEGGYFCCDTEKVIELVVVDDSIYGQVVCDIARYFEKDMMVFSKPQDNCSYKYAALEKLTENEFYDRAYANMLFD